MRKQPFFEQHPIRQTPCFDYLNTDGETVPCSKRYHTETVEFIHEQLGRYGCTTARFNSHSETPAHDEYDLFVTFSTAVYANRFAEFLKSKDVACEIGQWSACVVIPLNFVKGDAFTPVVEQFVREHADWAVKPETLAESRLKIYRAGHIRVSSVMGI